jgi:hypothetical protein
MQRRRVAPTLLQAARLEFHVELLEWHPPCLEWLNAIAQELGLKICLPQEIDADRRHFCDNTAISMFFVMFQVVIDGRDHRLAFNADETQLSARKRFRVLTGQGNLPLVKGLSNGKIAVIGESSFCRQ